MSPSGAYGSIEWNKSQPTEREEIALPTLRVRNGRTVRVWTVTYGTNHLAPGQTLQLLSKRLPEILQQILRFYYPAAVAQVQISTPP